ncbi:hypothetical protein ACIPWF_06790, partial [Paenarthrobacter sp. NPDC089989]|uniref:hypothetical protein n=1 Tax=unclassified Paenarthrobacter TaxID=2634190 RepID=UPI00382C1B59
FGTKDKTQQAQAWQGVGALGAAVFRSKAVIDRGFTDMDEGDIEALLTASAAIRETVHADEWATDYWRAGGQTTFDLATAATGGAGGGLTLEARLTALTNRLRSLPTKAASVAEVGGEAASASVKAGSGTAGLEAAAARIESHLAAVGKTVDDYEIPRATPESPGLPEELTPADGQTAKWSKEVSTPDLNVQPAQSKGIWTDDINRTKTTPPPELGPRTSGIDEARLRQRLNPATPERAASSSHAAPEAPEHSPGPGTHVGPSATLGHGADELLQTEDRSVDVNASGRPTSDPAHLEGPVQAAEVYGEPRAVHGEHPPYPEFTDKNREVMALRTDFEARWGRDDNGYGRPFTKYEYEIRYSGPEKNGQPRHVYPPFDGAILETLQKFHDLSAFVQKFGSQMDRVGPQSGRFIGVIENGVPATFEERSLPVAQLGDKYYQYKLVDAWPPDAKGWSIEVPVSLQLSDAKGAVYRW